MVAGNAWQTSEFILRNSTTIIKNLGAGNVVNATCTPDDRYHVASSTKPETNPAWAIDLELNYKIEYVNVSPSDLRYRLQDAYIIVTSEKPDLKVIDFTKYCAFFKGPLKLEDSRRVVRFNCRSEGRYLIIALKSEKGMLTMCKVEIYGRLSGNGGWSNWISWSDCSTTCGLGTKTRERRCDNPSPRNGGQDCLGDRIETAKCNERDCPEGSVCALNNELCSDSLKCCRELLCINIYRIYDSPSFERRCLPASEYGSSYYRN